MQNESKDDEQLERHLIETIGQHERAAGATGVSSSTVVSTVESKLKVPAVAVRGAIWRLIDSRRIEFTEGRRLKVKSHGSAT